MVREREVLDRGFVRLVGYLVDLVDTKPLSYDDHKDCAGFVVEDGHSLDAQVVRAARVSYGHGTKTVRDDERLIRYLIRHEHWSPFEMVVFKFHVKAPIFVARQWFRHRTASVNEVSARYSVVENEFYIPEDWRMRDSKNKQGSEGSLKQIDPLASEYAMDAYTEALDHAYRAYEALLAAGVAREMARMVLPVSVYTQFYWTQDLRNLLHFLKLRLASNAQWEIRQYAAAVLELIRPLVPMTISAWEEFVVKGE